jgi:hypothetical protein
MEGSGMEEYYFVSDKKPWCFWSFSVFALPVWLFAALPIVCKLVNVL